MMFRRKRTRSTKDQEKKDGDLGSETDPQSVNLEGSKAASAGASGNRNFLRQLHSPKDAEIESVNTCPSLVGSTFFSEID